MNVVINGLLLSGQFSGVQHSIAHMLQALGETEGPYRFEALLPRHYTGMLEQTNIAVTRVNCGNRLQRILWEQAALPVYLKRKQPKSIYHSPGYILPRWAPGPMVATIHDLVPLQHPEWSQRESVAYFKLALPPTLKRAQAIIAVSETVKQDILDRFPIHPGKIHVVYHGIRPGFRPIHAPQVLEAVALRYRLPGQFLLFVGNMEPRKNLEGLLQAYALLRQRSGTTAKLVVAGREAWKYQRVYQTVHTLGLTDAVQFLGYVPDEDLPALYNLATLFVFPSLYEGFGLPVLEAMACGTPAVIGNTGALPEIAGNAALLVPPHDADALATAIQQLLLNQELRHTLTAKGLERARTFSWSQAAADILHVYSTIGNV